jgi:hypothetical protein
MNRRKKRKRADSVALLLGPNRDFEVKLGSMEAAFKKYMPTPPSGDKRSRSFFIAGWMDSLQLAANAIVHMAEQCQLGCEISDSRIRAAIARHCHMPQPEARLPDSAILAARELTGHSRPTSNTDNTMHAPVDRRACACTHGKLTPSFFL